MSLICIAKTPSWAVAVCDDLVCRQLPTGEKIPAARGVRKMRTLPGDLLLVWSGRGWTGQFVSEVLEDHAGRHATDRSLFADCAELVSFAVRQCHDKHPDHEFLVGLVGFDRATDRVRTLAWSTGEGLAAIEDVGADCVFGHPEGGAVALDVLDAGIGKVADIPGAVSLLADAMREVAAKVPDRVGTQTFWHIIQKPAVRVAIPDAVLDGSTYGRTKLDGINTGYVWKTVGVDGVKNIKGVGDSQTLDMDTEVADGDSRYAATPSVLSYRALGNPLSSYDDGATASIDIAAFTLRTSNLGDIEIDGGTVAGLNYGTTYYVFFDDLTLAGGAVTFQATLSKELALQGAGRICVGSIVTADETGYSTRTLNKYYLGGGSVAVPGARVGNNDSGVGAQNGDTMLYLPSAASGFTNSMLALDGDSATYASCATVGFGSLIASGFPGVKSLRRSALTVCIDHEAVGSGIYGVTLSVSLDAGTSWYDFASYSSAPIGRTVDAVALPPDTNMALVQVKYYRTGSTSITSRVYEVCLEEES